MGFPDAVFQNERTHTVGGIHGDTFPDVRPEVAHCVQTPGRTSGAHDDGPTNCQVVHKTWKNIKMRKVLSSGVSAGNN